MKETNSYLGFIIIILIASFIIWLILNSLLGLFGGGFSGGKYRAYKCNYRYSSDVLQEFGGDPCMKKGNNRFKSYYSKKFKSLSDRQYWIDTEDMSYLKAPSNKYVLGCDKK